MSSTSGIWVFGYGSLVWNPGFDFVRSQIGHIRGYDRRFWQGNDKHRGTKDRMGRVATLVERKEGLVWGRAFLLRDNDRSSGASLRYLDERESKLGGYRSLFVQFRPRDPREDPFPALVYIATANNPLYLGPTDTATLADEVLASSGPSGTNAEYVLRLAQFMREEVPDVWDEHLFSLESLIRVRLKDDPEVNALYGDGLLYTDYRKPSSSASTLEELDAGDGGAGDVAEDSSQVLDFASAVSSTKLRCLQL